MPAILAIAKREVLRVRSRFRGASQPIVIPILLGALILSYLAFRQGATFSQGSYRVGISPDGPVIDDSRFIVTVVDRPAAYSKLSARSLDVYVDGTQVILRDDDRSQYAAGAVRQYLEKQELERIAIEYDIDQAFPLRIEVDYLTATVGTGIQIAPLLSEAYLPDLSEVDPSLTERDSPSAAADSGTETKSDAAVRQQVSKMGDSGGLPEIDLAADTEIIIPSLMDPPIPFAQVIVAFLYIMPITFISVFFTSSFMNEKTDRRITVLMSAPITPFQIIVGKMLPYITFSLLSVVAITILLRGNVLLAVALLAPVILFIFAIYLMVPLLYRTFKDTTFISMLAVTLITSYLIFPAMFSGVNDLSYISPLTLVVHMYRGEPFGLDKYLFSAVPIVLIFALSMYIGTRILNEEYLMRFRPLYRKLADALYLVQDRDHPHVSILLLSLFLIPIVYMIQLAILAVSLNLPIRVAIGILLFAATIIEEIAKSAGIAVLFENEKDRPVGKIVVLSFLSAAGFLIGEKLILLVSLSVVAESVLSAALFNSGLLIIPMLAHFGFTSLVCLLNSRLRVRYAYAVIAGATVHTLYNLVLLRGIL